MHLLHSLRNAYIFKEIWLFNDLNSLFQINNTFFKHSKFLETHGHVEVCNIGEVSIPFAMFNVHYFQNTLCLLQEYICFFKLIFFNEFICNISEFKQEKWDFILINFYFFVIESMKTIILISVSMALIGSFYFNIRFLTGFRIFW